jgi:DNA-binding protein HU-beta
MNKSELVEEIAGRTRLPAGDVALVVDAFIETVTRSVKRGDKVVLSGFGTFHRKARARRTARNILADKPLVVKATNVPAFRPGKPFREQVARRRVRARAVAGGRARPRATEARTRARTVSRTT